MHVVDAASPALLEHQAEVERVLGEIGAADVPQVLVYNKVDQLAVSRLPRVDVDTVQVHPGLLRARVFISARDATGIDALRGVIADIALAHLNAPAEAPVDDDPRAVIASATPRAN